MIILDAKQMERRAQAHAYLKGQLSFPDYYGNNLDALHDCLTSLPPTQVCFIHEDECCGGYFGKIMRVFRDSAKENPNLKILAAAETDEAGDAGNAVENTARNSHAEPGKKNTAAGSTVEEKDRSWS